MGFESLYPSHIERLVELVYRLLKKVKEAVDFQRFKDVKSTAFLFVDFLSSSLYTLLNGWSDKAYIERLVTMPTQEERILNLEQAHKDAIEAVKDINHYVTLMYGVAGKQEVDIREIKISLRSVNEQLDAVDRRLDVVDHRLEPQDKKLDQILGLLSTLTPKPEQ